MSDHDTDEFREAMRRLGEGPPELSEEFARLVAVRLFKMGLTAFVIGLLVGCIVGIIVATLIHT